MRPRRGPAVENDAEVVEISRREPERFAVLFDRHAQHIYRYVARRAGPQVADDVVAETFLVAFAKRDRHDLAHPDARPWLYGIATNLVGQHHRDEARQYRMSQATVADPAVDGHAARVAADVTAQATRPLLYAALAALPPGDRDVLLLIAWEELTYREVSRALDIPVGTVRSRLHRARAQTRRVLAGTDAAATYEEITTNE